MIRLCCVSKEYKNAVMANLPPLARLRLGASTGNGADSDEEHAHEPLDRRAYRKFPKLAPAPDVTTLAKMPAEVVEILVERTAIAARAEAEPARAMCEWMKALCRSAKLAGVAGCEDHWYYLALAAFGFTPAPTEVAGEAPTLPAYSAFPNWRTFFGALCEAFYGTGVKRFDQHQSREWLKGQDAFFRYVRYKVHGNMRQGNDISPTFLKRFLDPNATQRALDKLLDELLDGELERRTWARADREAAGNAYQAASWRESRTSRMRTQERDRFNLSFVNWINELDSELSTDESPWAAVVTLFLLRGAKPWQEEKYRQADTTLWAVTKAWALYEEGILGNPGSGLVGPLTPDEYRAKSLAWVRKSLDEGADPNYYHPETREPIMDAVLKMRNEEALALMFAHGAHVPIDSAIAFRVFDTAVTMMFQAPTMGTPWPYSEATTETLIAMLVAFWVGLIVPAQRRTILTRLQGYVLHPSEQTPVWLCDLWKQMLPNIQSNSITF